jgi:hemerythrin-like domain-containing protein
MRPLKYPHLGDMRLVRVSNLASKVLTDLQDVMEKLEATDDDSVTVIRDTLNSLSDRLDEVMLTKQM